MQFHIVLSVLLKHKLKNNKMLHVNMIDLIYRLSQTVQLSSVRTGGNSGVTGILLIDKDITGRHTIAPGLNRKIVLSFTTDRMYLFWIFANNARKIIKKLNYLKK